MALRNFVDPYLIPGSSVLRNKLGLKTHTELARAEYRFTLLQRRILDEEPVIGDFDLPHLQEIHFRLFQDIFDWAGQIRTVDIQKQNSHFQQVSALGTGANYVFNQLQDGPLLREDSVPDSGFVTRMSTLFEQINYLHPFREGNGRTQRAFLDQVAAQSGRTLSWRNVSQAEHIAASIQCHEQGSGGPYEQIFAKIIEPPQDGRSLLDDSERGAVQKGGKMPAPPELTVESALKGVKETEVHLRNAKADYEAAITAAKIEAGASYAQIAEAAGLTRSGVQAVLRRQRG